MKDKETLNLLLIMVVSIVLLIILYLPEKKPNNTAQFNFIQKNKDVHLYIHAQYTNPITNHQLIEFQQIYNLKK